MTTPTATVPPDLLFRSPELVDGKILLGRYLHADDPTYWRLYTENRMWGGLVTGGTAGACRRLLEQIALCAMFGGRTYLVYIDGHDGNGSAHLRTRAGERYATHEVHRALKRLVAMALRRQVIQTATQRAGFTPSLAYPGVLVVAENAEHVVTESTAARWTHLARIGPKVGIAPAFAVPDRTRTQLEISPLASLLLAGNAVEIESLAHPGQPAGGPDTPVAPDLAYPVLAIPFGASAPAATFHTNWLPSRSDAAHRQAAGNPLPHEYLLLDDWFRLMRDIHLDPTTAGAANDAAPIR